MTPPPLAIIQARMASTRLPGKVMLPLADGRPILAHVYWRAVEAFGAAHVVIATTSDPSNAPIVAWAREHSANDAFTWNGPEADVLGRFYHCAHRYRWRPDSVIVRVTADDPFKHPDTMRKVAAGERHPVEVGAEAFTLAMLDAAHRQYLYPLWVDRGVPEWPNEREHITSALFPTAPPPAPPGIWTVDTPEQYEAAVARSRTG